QRTLNEIVGTGVKIGKDFAAAIELIGDAIGPVNKALGGFDHTLELVLVVGLLQKLRRGAAGFGLLATASGVTSTKMVADAGRVEAAWDAATRPRNMVVTTTVIGAGAFPGGKVPPGTAPPVTR